MLTRRLAHTMELMIVAVGKLKNNEFKALVEDYVKRLEHYATIRCLEVKDSNVRDEGRALLDRSEGTYRIVLDERGQQITSVAFARMISNLTKDASFIIGGPEGLSEEATKKADLLLSLSRMTLPHELCRVLLAEQVYRAYTLINKEHYHR